MPATSNYGKQIARYTASITKKMSVMEKNKSAPFGNPARLTISILKMYK